MTSTQLKILAITSMLIDHAGAILFPQFFALRVIGRLAFPIFAFAIVQGYIHTRDLKKYIIRLFVFGVISEVPFDLAFQDSFIFIGYQNVFFNLALGLITLALFDKYKDVSFTKAKVCVLLMALLATLLVTDYFFIGILTMFYMYYYKDDFKKQVISVGLVMLFFCLPGAVFEIMAGRIPSFDTFLQFYSILAFVPIYFYNNKKGANIKYLFYAFYPGHLLVLYIIDKLI